MAAVSTIRRFGVLSIAAFPGVVGLVWGFLAGIILLAGYIQGYLANGDSSVIQAGLYGFALMIGYGIIGGIIGGVILALVYNRFLGEKHSIRVELGKG